MTTDKYSLYTCLWGLTDKICFVEGVEDSLKGMWNLGRLYTIRKFPASRLEQEKRELLLAGKRLVPLSQHCLREGKLICWLKVDNEVIVAVWVYNGRYGHSGNQRQKYKTNPSRRDN